MMHPFEATMGVAGALALVIVGLTLFFRLLGALDRRSAGAEAEPSAVGLKGVLDRETRTTVHLATGTTFEGVRFIGFTNADSAKGRFPYELTGMVILEHEDGRRTLVQAKLIRMIEVPPKGS